MADPISSFINGLGQLLSPQSPTTQVPAVQDATNPTLSPNAPPPQTPQPPGPTPSVSVPQAQPGIPFGGGLINGLTGQQSATTAFNPVTGQGGVIGANPLDRLGFALNPEAALNRGQAIQRGLGIQQTEQQISNERLQAIQSQQTIANNAASQQAMVANAQRLRSLGVQAPNALVSDADLQTELTNAASKGNAAALAALPPAQQQLVMPAYNGNHDSAQDAISDNIQRLNNFASSPTQYQAAANQARQDLQQYGYTDLSTIIPDDPRQWPQARQQLAGALQNVDNLVVPYRNKQADTLSFTPADKDEVDRIQQRVAPDPVFGGATNFDVKFNPARQQSVYDVTPVAQATPHGPNQPIVSGDSVKTLTNGVSSDLNTLRQTQNLLQRAIVSTQASDFQTNPLRFNQDLEALQRYASGGRATKWGAVAQETAKPYLQQIGDWLQRNVDQNTTSDAMAAQIRSVLPEYLNDVQGQIADVTHGSVYDAGQLGIPLDAVLPDKSVAYSKDAEAAWQAGHQASVSRYTQGAVSYRGKLYQVSDRRLGQDFPTFPNANGGQPPYQSSPPLNPQQNQGQTQVPPAASSGGNGPPPVSPQPSTGGGPPNPATPTLSGNAPNIPVGQNTPAGFVVPQQHYAFVQQSATQMGANPVLARNAAIMLTSAAANESDFNPTTVHDNGIGYGLYGHNGDRLAAMRAATGQQTPSPQGQTMFATRELLTSQDPSIVEARRLLSNPNATAQDIATAQMMYEKPKGYQPGSPQTGIGWSARLASTQRLMNGDFSQFNRTAPPSAPLSTSQGDIQPSQMAPPAPGSNLPQVPTQTPLQRITAQANAASQFDPNTVQQQQPTQPVQQPPQDDSLFNRALALSAGVGQFTGGSQVDALWRTYGERNGKSYSDNLADVGRLQASLTNQYPATHAVGAAVGLGAGVAAPEALSAEGIGTLGRVGVGASQGMVATPSLRPGDVAKGAVEGAAGQGAGELAGFIGSQGFNGVENAFKAYGARKVLSDLASLPPEQLNQMSPEAEITVSKFAKQGFEPAINVMRKVATARQAQIETTGANQQTALREASQSAGRQASESEAAGQRGIERVRNRYALPDEQEPGNAIQRNLRQVQQDLKNKTDEAFDRARASNAKGAADVIGDAHEKALQAVEKAGVAKASLGPQPLGALDRLDRLAAEADNGTLSINKLMDFGTKLRTMADVTTPGTPDFKAMKAIRSTYHDAVADALVKIMSEDGAQAAMDYNTGRRLSAQYHNVFEPPGEAGETRAYKILESVANKPDATAQDVVNEVLSLNEGGLGRAATNTVDAYNRVTADIPGAQNAIKAGIAAHLVEGPQLPMAIAKRMTDFLDQVKTRGLAEKVYSPEERSEMREIARDLAQNGKDSEFFRDMQQSLRDQSERTGSQNERVANQARDFTARQNALTPSAPSEGMFHYASTLIPAEALFRGDFKRAFVEWASAKAASKVAEAYKIGNMSDKIAQVLGRNRAESPAWLSWSADLSRSAQPALGVGVNSEVQRRTLPKTAAR